jgi:hypothetical protein
MNLQQIHDTAAARSFFVRPDTEVWTAISTASRFVYQAIAKERRQFFRTLDITTITLQPNVQEYQLPADCEQLVRLRERINAQDTWRQIYPTDPQDREGTNDTLSPTVNYAGYGSGFFYQGPYLTMATANDGQDDETYTIYITPIPADTRQVEILYDAKFIEVATGTDNYIIPVNLRDAVLDLTVAELVRPQSDSLANDYEQSGAEKLNMALTLIRMRQVQQDVVVNPYLSEFMT